MIKNKIEPVLINKKYLEDKIYIIRGQKVMLDSDLAEIYGYDTRGLNKQIKNNIEKFDSDFMFQITRQELDNLVMCKNYTSRNITTFKGQNGGTRKLPFVFTEKGIYMLMTVLRGPLAIKQSKALIRLFDSMKKYLIENRELISINELDLKTKLLEKDVNDIKNDNKYIKMVLKKVMDNFIDLGTYKHFLILNGKKLESDIAYKNIFKQASQSIIYIDNYIGLKTLELLSFAKKNVSITIFSENKSKPSLTESMINDFNIQNKTNKLSLYTPSLHFHDRYIILDFNTTKETIYHCGASLKDSGNKISTITKLEHPSLYKAIINKLIKKIKNN